MLDSSDIFISEANIEQPRRVLVLVPSRFASTRFPGKPLAKILDKTMVEWVFKNCAKAENLDQQTAPKFETYIVTDSQEIEEEVKSFGGRALRVDDDVISGTERIYLAWERNFKDQDFDLVINVQGDEPLLNEKDLLEIANFHLNSNFDMTTLVHPRTDEEGLKDPNKVKAVYVEETGQCLYFSRSAVPYEREKGELKEWHLHVGVYSFKPKALEKFFHSEPSRLEKIECLEQLRALENGMTIGALKTNKQFMGVDTPEDIGKLESLLGETNG